MMLKTPVTTKNLGYKSMIYYTYYGSPIRTEQRFCPFCVLFTHGHVKSHQRYIMYPKGLTQLLLTLSFPCSYSLGVQALLHHAFEGQYLLKMCV